MPQELLRDVLRTGDASNRQRHWSVLPLTIVGHALVVGAVVIAPLGAEVDPPSVSSPPRAAPFMPTTAPPAPPPPRVVTAAVRPDAGAPIQAPPSIVPEREPARFSTVPVVDGALDALSSAPSVGSVGRLVAPPPLPKPAPPQPKLVRAGYGVREPRKIVHVAPEYPELARRARVDGTVILEAVLDVAGRVEQVHVLRSVPLLDEAAIRAVREWRYTPTELNGVPVPVLMTITVTFSLR